MKFEENLARLEDLVAQMEGGRLSLDDMMKNFAEIVRGKENPYPYDYEMKLFELVMKASGEDTKA